MKQLFSGRKRLVTIPLGVIFCLIFLPYVLFGLVVWLIATKVRNKNLKIASFVGLGGLVVLGILGSTLNSDSSGASVSSFKQSENGAVPTAMELVQSTIGPREVIVPTSGAILLISPTTEPVPTLVPVTPTPVLVSPTRKPTSVVTVSTTTPQVKVMPVYGGGYVCDCKKTCTEIMSCGEAQFLLNKCGCSQRDGDKDGIACDGAPLNCQN